MDENKMIRPMDFVRLTKCLAECSDYDLYELVHNIETDSDQGK